MNKYVKPKIRSEFVKLSFFSSNLWWVSQFDITGKVFAQSGISGESLGGDADAESFDDIGASIATSDGPGDFGGENTGEPPGGGNL